MLMRIILTFLVTLCLSIGSAFADFDSRLFFTGDNSTTSYTVSFPYLAQSDVEVYEDGILTTDWSWTNNTTITMDTAPSTGTIVEIRRSTDKSTITRFTYGSTPSTAKLNSIMVRMQYISQETKDIASTGPAIDADGNYDFGGEKLLNVETGTASTDGVNKGQMDTELAGKQDLDSDLTAIAALSTTSHGRGLLDDSTASDSRTSIGVGTISTQDSDSVTITGGSITGITDVAVADGGTGASTASGARTNLGLGSIATLSAPSGDVVGTSDTQTLTNKTIDTASNTITIEEADISDLTHTTARTDEEIEDLSGGMVTGNTESGISVVYQDGDGTLDFTVDSSSTSQQGIMELATTAETTTGTDTARAVTPDGLEDGYDGSANLTTLGTISTGTWEATDVGVAHGGTGASTASDARDNLGLTIGTDVQAQDAELDALAGLTSAANKGIMFDGSESATTFDLTTAGLALLDDANASAQRTTLGLGTIATQAANNVSITGGSVTGITDLTLADGGTGQSLVDPGADGILIWDDSDTGSEWNFATIGSGLSFDGSELTATGGGGGGDVVDDTTPQLGGDLDVNGNSITSASAGDIPITPDTTGDVILDGLKWPQADGSANELLYTDGSAQLAFGDFDTISPMTTEHDIIAQGASGAERVAGPTGSGNYFYWATGNGAATTNSGWLSSGTTTAVLSAATTSTKGVVELATTAETTTGTDTARVVTPDGLEDGYNGSANVVTVGTLTSGDATGVVDAASTTAAGKVELATTAEADTGTDTARAVTPEGVLSSINANAATVAAFLNVFDGPQPQYTSASTVTISDGFQCVDDSGTAFIRFTSDQVVNMASSGENGLDASDTEAGDTTYFLFAIRKSSDGTVGGILTDNPAGPDTMPTGYDQKRLVMVFRNDNSSNFIASHTTEDGWVLYDTAISYYDGGGFTAASSTTGTNVLNTGTSATAATDIDLTAFADENVTNEVKINVYGNDASEYLQLRTNGASVWQHTLSISAAAVKMMEFLVTTDSSGIIEYISSNAAMDVAVDVIGFKLDRSIAR